MKKNKRISLFVTIGVIIAALAVLGWFIANVFEGEKPQIDLQPLPEFLSQHQEFTLNVSDRKRGLKRIQVMVNQEGREISVLNVPFSFKGLLNQNGLHQYETRFSIDPSELNLAQGRIDLTIQAWDHSRRRGGDGNMALLQHKMIVDTIPPSIRAMSRQHYINVGGTGLVVYQTSSDAVDSGVYVNEQFFEGFPAAPESAQGYHVCYFTVSIFESADPEIYLWTEDQAGNRSNSHFYYHVRNKRFRSEKIRITDRFIGRILPYFSFYPFSPDVTDVDKFLKLNRDMRKENARTFYALGKETAPEQLWEGDWVRLPNAANMAQFGDQRFYCYEGKQIDKQTHLGVDLASLANSRVPAANKGKVIYAGRIGIYGETVVLDHGQGIATGYSHLSGINVTVGQEVFKGETIGVTGQTGMAIGDHLHFSVMVHGICVNPIEWWDDHWVQDNILRKLTLYKQ